MEQIDENPVTGMAVVGFLTAEETVGTSPNERYVTIDFECESLLLVKAVFEEELTTISARGGLRKAVSRSRIAGISRTLVRYVRHSWLYQWFTHEPEPDVIVIDLRETYTVGPIIRLLDWLFEQCGQATDASKTVAFVKDIERRFPHRPLQVVGVAMLAAVSISTVVTLVLGHLNIVLFVGHGVLAVLSCLGLRSERTLEDLTETRAWTVLVAAFEPPEPPDAESGDSSSGEPESDEERR